MTDDGGFLLDPARCACLCDLAADYVLAVAVEPDGATHYVLAHQPDIGDPAVRYTPDCPDAAHEQPGPLPPRWAARVELAPLRCGRRTRSGRRCRVPVARPNAACGRHRTAPTTTERNHQ